MTQWLRNHDGVHVLLSDRSEVGWYTIPERHSKINNDIPYSCEYIPEHLHHNWKNTKAYVESRKRRGVEGASIGQFAKGISNPKYL